MDDTIAAISTPYGTGGIGIIRISGSKAFDIAKELFYGKDFDNIKTHTINYGKIIEKNSKKVIDEVLLTKMEKPNTFTREDIIEINCHGGIIVLKEILELILLNGARTAEPGEFTKRAFLNGRIDLAQAEAVIDIINSKSEESKKAAINQLEGRLSELVKNIRQKLIEILAKIEVKIDYPEYDIEDVTKREVEDSLIMIKNEIENLYNTFDRGKILKEGIKAVIAGRPNVGKSSLLNELIGNSRAIVTNIPGTTRDTIEEFINIKGVPLQVIDTAGIRETEDLIEKIGIENSKKVVKTADLLIYMIESSKNSDTDIEIIKTFDVKNKIIVFNKIDLGKKENIPSFFKEFINIEMSIKDSIGIDELENKIVNLFRKGEINVNNEILITNVRHKKLLRDSIKALDAVLIGLNDFVPIDLLSIEISDSADFLGQIIGESVREDIISEIFKNFCIGK